MRSSTEVASVGDDPVVALSRARIWLPLAGPEDHLLAGLPVEVVRAVALARTCGTPVVPVLDAAAEVAEHRLRLDRDVAEAIGPAVSVARGLLMLPLLAVPLLAGVLGLDLVDFYLRQPLGRLVAIIVIALMTTAGLWMHAAIRTAGTPRVRQSGLGAAVGLGLLGAIVVAWWLAPLVTGLWYVRARRVPAQPHPNLDEAIDLVATAMTTGLAIPAALRLAADHLDDTSLADSLRGLALRLALSPPATTAVAGTDAHRRSPVPAGLGPLATLLDDLTTSGGPGVGHLRDVAADLREDRAAQVRIRVARLGSRLTFPTVLLMVPATVLAIGAPIIVHGLEGLAGS